jgi:hypothetical protein
LQKRKNCGGKFGERKRTFTAPKIAASRRCVYYGFRFNFGRATSRSNSDFVGPSIGSFLSGAAAGFESFLPGPSGHSVLE